MSDKTKYFNEDETQAFKELLSSIDSVYVLQEKLTDLLSKDDRFGIRTSGATRILCDRLNTVKDCANDLFDAAVMDLLVKEAKLVMNDPEKNFGDQPEFNDDLWF